MKVKRILDESLFHEKEYVNGLRKAKSIIEKVIKSSLAINEGVDGDSDKIDHLVSSLRTGDTKTAKFLVDSNQADINGFIDGGISILSWIILKDRNVSISTIDTILKLGANPNLKNKSDGNTPLHAACSLGSQRGDDIFDLLLSYRPDLSVVNDNGDTLLHIVALHPSLFIAKKLLYTHQVDTDKKNNDGYTPALLLVDGVRKNLIKSDIKDVAALLTWLLAMKSNPSETTKEGENLLSIAKSIHDSKARKLILQTIRKYS